MYVCVPFVVNNASEKTGKLLFTILIIIGGIFYAATKSIMGVLTMKTFGVDNYMKTVHYLVCSM